LLEGLFSAPAPAVGCTDAEAIAQRDFGIVAAASELSSERDRNFRLTTANGRGYVLKVSNAAESAAITSLQTAALRYLERACPQLPVPRLIRSLGGADELILDVDGERHIVRLMTFLPGVPSSQIAPSVARRRSLGRMLAILDTGLAEFTPPAAAHDLIWDLARAERVGPLVDGLRPGRRQLAGGFLEAYVIHASPVLPRLRRQTIHNDFNPDNILVGETDEDGVTGIIDFGDLVRAPLVNELAIAAAYQAIASGEPLEALTDLTAGYHEVTPLAAAELDVLFDLTVTRVVMIVAISEWRAARHAGNRGYILRNTERAWTCLERFAAIPRADARQSLRQACGVA
jgi:hydroxylysine kinase